MIRAEQLCAPRITRDIVVVLRQRGRLKSYFVATNDAIKQRRLRVEKRHATKLKSMKTIASPRGITAIAFAAALLLAAYSLAYAQQDQPLAPAAANEEAPPIPADQLDSLVAPIALYPDPLLAQTLAASTYPLELIQLQQWMAKNSTLKAKALAAAVAKQPWDPSIQSMAAVPELVKRLADDIQWTTQLGDAFL